VIPTVAGALVTVANGLEKNLRKAGTTVSVDLLQKAALLRTAQKRLGSWNVDTYLMFP